MLLSALTACVHGTGENFLNKAAPNPLLYPISGSPQRLDSFKGYKTVLVFWSTYCSTSMKELRQLAKEFKNNPALADVVGIAINIDGQDREQKVFDVINNLPKSHLQFSYSSNDIYDEAYNVFDVSVVPQFFALDAEGIVREESLDADITSYFEN